MVKKIEDHYKTLGVSRNATLQEIQKSYRTLAKKYHPDTKNNIPENVKEDMIRKLNAAYQVLSNDKSRTIYDYDLKSYEADALREENLRRQQEAEKKRREEEEARRKQEELDEEEAGYEAYMNSFNYDDDNDEEDFATQYQKYYGEPESSQNTADATASATSDGSFNSSFNFFGTVLGGILSTLITIIISPLVLIYNILSPLFRPINTIVDAIVLYFVCALFLSAITVDPYPFSPVPKSIFILIMFILYCFILYARFTDGNMSIGQWLVTIISMASFLLIHPAFRAWFEVNFYNFLESILL